MADFFALHRSGDPLIVPDAWDVASAAALAAAGFAAVGTTSPGVAAAHGLPDGQASARAGTVALVRRLSRLPVLLTVDIEGGFGDDPDEVADLAADLAGAGAAGVTIEDGRAGGTLAPATALAELIIAVKAQVPDLFVNARTDTYSPATGEPPPLHVTLSRLETYVAAGADGVFVPGLSGADTIRSVVRGIEAPLTVLLLPGMTVSRLAGLGVARISTGSMLFRAALDAAVTLARSVARDEPAPTGIPEHKS